MDFITGFPCHWPLLVFDQWEPLTEDLRTDEECGLGIYSFGSSLPGPH